MSEYMRTLLSRLRKEDVEFLGDLKKRFEATEKETNPDALRVFRHLMLAIEYLNNRLYFLLERVTDFITKVEALDKRVTNLEEAVDSLRNLEEAVDALKKSLEQPLGVEEQPPATEEQA